MSDIKEKTLRLIDGLKATCQTYGMGNDGNEYKIITQVFLYKFLNDKFGYEVKNAKSDIAKKLNGEDKWETAYGQLSEDERMLLLAAISPDVPMLEPYHLVAYLWNKQGKGDFDTIFDATMTDIAEKNADIFSTQTTANTKIPLFEPLTQFVTDTAQRAPFARALVDKLVNFSFEEAFAQNYDFFSSIFEYLIKDYNTAGGGKYAEYYTPHAIATIMARLLVGDNADLHSMECYDPSAGTGTLLMALSHQIGEDRCTIFSQDISQRSNKMLKLNLLGGVHNVFPVQVAYVGGGNGAVPGNIGRSDGDGSTQGSHDFHGIVIVVGQDGAGDHGVVAQLFVEQGTHGPVNDPAVEDAPLGGLAFPAVEGAGDPAYGVHPLLKLDGQGEVVDAGLGKARAAVRGADVFVLDIDLRRAEFAVRACVVRAGGAENDDEMIVLRGHDAEGDLVRDDERADIQCCAGSVGSRCNCHRYPWPWMHISPPR